MYYQTGCGKERIRLENVGLICSRGIAMMISQSMFVLHLASDSKMRFDDSTLWLVLEVVSKQTAIAITLLSTRY